MGKHEITMGKEAITDIGFLINREMLQVKHNLERSESMLKIASGIDEGNKAYWSTRVDAQKEDLARLEAYNNIIMGASSITVEHDVKA